MGTVVSFDVPGRAGGTGGTGVQEAVRWLHWVDEVFSTYRPDSQIRRLERGELALGECAAEVGEILELCARAEAESGGYFSARAAGGSLDPSGAVKGWAIERASEILARAGAGNHCVNGGGDVQVQGTPEEGRGWSVAVAHPLRRGSFATVVTGAGPLAVATSGSAERGAHVLDPHTGRPAEGLASVTVVGSSLTEADIAATAAFAMGAEARDWIEDRPGLEGFAVLPSGRAWWTSGFPEYGLVPTA